MKSNYYLLENYINLARNYKIEGDNKKALKFYKKALSLEEGKEDIDLLLDLALLYDEINFKELAIETYKKVLKVNSGEASAYYGLGIIYDEKGEFLKAKEYYEKAININPGYDKAYFFLANILDEQGEKKVAIENYKKVIEINNSYLWAYANIGCILEEQNKNIEALKYLEKAEELNPKQYRVLFNIGVVLVKLNRIEEGRGYYRKSIKYNPLYPYSYLNLAVSHKIEKDYLKGIEILSVGIKNTDRAFLYYNRGCTYNLLGLEDEALKDIQKSIKLDSFFYEYSLKDKELENIWNKITRRAIDEL